MLSIRQVASLSRLVRWSSAASPSSNNSLIQVKKLFRRLRPLGRDVEVPAVLPDEVVVALASLSWRLTCGFWMGNGLVEDARAK